MAGLAQWLAARRFARTVLIALLFAIPLLAVASAGLVALGAIARGWRDAARDCVGALLILVGLTVVAGGFWAGVGIGAALTWSVALLLGSLARGSLTLAVQVAVLLGLAGALLFMVWSRDPEQFWEQVLVDLAERARTAGIEIGPADLLPEAAQVMTGMMSASAVASALVTLFLGRWWAGSLRGETFGAAFRQLRMGRVLGLVAGLLGVAYLTPLGHSVDDLLLVLGTGFVVQGLSVIHWHGDRRGWPRSWPVLLYVPLALVPALAAIEMLLLALLGLADNGYSLRRAGGKVV